MPSRPLCLRMAIRPEDSQTEASQRLPSNKVPITARGSSNLIARMISASKLVYSHLFSFIYMILNDSKWFWMILNALLLFRRIVHAIFHTFSQRRTAVQDVQSNSVSSSKRQSQAGDECWYPSELSLAPAIYTCKIMQIRVHNTCVKMRQDAPKTELSPVVTFQIAKVIA